MTRALLSQIESLKQLAASPEHGSLRRMNANLFERFLFQRPYKSKAFFWTQPPKVGTPDAVAFNVVLDDAMSERIKAEATKLDISLQTFLYTGLVWWLRWHDLEPGPQE